MTRDEFLQRASNLGIDPRSFSLNEVTDEAYVMVHESHRWTTFYSERGLRTGECHFRSEEDALDDLFRRIRSGR